MVLTWVLWDLQLDVVWTKSQYSNGLENGFSQSFWRFTHKVDLDALVDELSNPLGKGCGSDYADHEVTNLS